MRKLILVLGAVVGCSSSEPPQLVYVAGHGGASSDAAGNESAVGSDAQADDATQEHVDTDGEDPPDADAEIIPEPTPEAGPDVIEAAPDAIEEPECTGWEDCPGSDTDCTRRDCLSGHCGISYLPLGTPVGVVSECVNAVCDGAGAIINDNVDDGTPTSTQTTGDCATRICNGVGGTKQILDSADIVPDGDVCTADSCTSSGPVFSPIGDNQCHAVCAVDPSAVLLPAKKDCGTTEIGYFPSGAYTTCGTDLLVPPGVLPGDYQYYGVMWDVKVGAQTEHRYCGDVAHMAAIGVKPAAGYYLGSCPPGSPCNAEVHLTENGGCTALVSLAGVCQ